MNGSIGRVVIFLAGLVVGGVVVLLALPPTVEVAADDRPHSGLPGPALTSGILPMASAGGAGPAISAVNNRETRELLEDFASLAPTDPDSPNTALVRRMSALLPASDESRRTLHFSALLELMRAVDAPAVAEMFENLRLQGLKFDPEANFFAQRWGELDPDAALAYLVDGGHFERNGILVNRVMSGWASKAPAEAADWLTYQPDGPLKDEATLGTATGWGRRNPEAATEFVLALPKGQLRQRAAQTVFWQVLYQYGLPAATTWFDGLPEDQPAIRRAVLPYISQRMLESDYLDAQTWVDKRTSAIAQ